MTQSTRTPDPAKARSLRETVAVILERLETTNQEKYPALSVVDYYTALHALLESKAALEGYKYAGDGAHQQLIEAAVHNATLSDTEGVLLQELRSARNGVVYEGQKVTLHYFTVRRAAILKVLSKLSEVHT